MVTTGFMAIENIIALNIAELLNLLILKYHHNSRQYPE